MASKSKAVCLLLVSLALLQSTVHARCLPASLQLAQRLPRTDDEATADVILEALQELTELSDDLRTETANIKEFNVPTEGGKIAPGLAEITNKLNETSQAIPPWTSPVDHDNATQVVDAFGKFVQAQLALLNTVIQKHHLLTLVPYFEGIQRALETLQLVNVGFSNSLLAILPSDWKVGVLIPLGSWTNTIDRAVSTYSSPFLKTAVAHAFH